LEAPARFKRPDKWKTEIWAEVQAAEKEHQAAIDELDVFRLVQ
jgi:hypothetical protein